jgi:ligand-binding sensor domain-containing protein
MYTQNFKILSIILVSYFIFFVIGCSHVETTTTGLFTSIRPPSDTDAMALDGDKIWVGGKDGVVKIDRKTFAITKFQEALPYTRALLVDNVGVLWIGWDGGIVRGKDGMYEHFTQKEGLPDPAVNALLQRKDGTILIGTPKGVVTWDGQQVVPYLSAKDGLINNDGRVLFEDSHQNLWVGSYSAPAGGISIVSNDGSIQPFSTETGLPHNDITSFAEAMDGTIWVGTGFLDHGGVAQFSYIDNAWVLTKTINQQDGLAGPKIRSLFKDKDGTMWMGFEVEGLTRPTATGWELFTKKDGLPDNEIKIIIQDEQGRMWFGTRNGVGVKM